MLQEPTRIFYLSDEEDPFCLQAIRLLLQFAIARSTLLFSSDAKSIFQWLDSKICIVDHYDQVSSCASEHSSIIIPVRDYPRVHDNGFLKRFTPSIIDLVNSGSVSLFFDFSNEASTPRAIQTFAAKMKIIGFTNLGQIHWICGNELLPSKLFGISHHKYNYFEIKSFVSILNNLEAWQFNDGYIYGSYKEACRMPHVLSLNETPRPERVASILCLFKYGVLTTKSLTKSTPNLPYLSFGGFKNVKGLGAPTQEKIRNWLQSEQMDDLLPYFDWLCDKELAVDSFKERGNLLFSKIDASVYRKTVLSYVTETTMQGGVSRYTEKSVKPLLLGHPIIVAGTKGNIQQIRQLGFSVLDHIIDHSYDNEPDVATRIRMSAQSAKTFLEKLSACEPCIVEEITHHLQSNISWGVSGYPMVLFSKATSLLSSICKG